MHSGRSSDLLADKGKSGLRFGSHVCMHMQTATLSFSAEDAHQKWEVQENQQRTLGESPNIIFIACSHSL